MKIRAFGAGRARGGLRWCLGERRGSRSQVPAVGSCDRDSEQESVQGRDSDNVGCSISA